MLLETLDRKEVLDGYAAISQLYPNIPPLLIWRAWEYAAYRRLEMIEPVLDLGCGDGRFFRTVWPSILHVDGVDREPAAIVAAQAHGHYQRIWHADAADLPEELGTFATVFANCSLEHMDNIQAVMASAYRILRPGGRFVFSIINSRAKDWFMLPVLVRSLGAEALASDLYQAWLNYHHLVNHFSDNEWIRLTEAAGFRIIRYLPILPEMTAKLFLLLDSLWHTGETPDALGLQWYATLQDVPLFPLAFQRVLEGALLLENRFDHGCGAIFEAQRVELHSP